MESRSIDPSMEINLFRLIQEGLNNIRKHAAASEANVRLVAAFPNIVLRIDDDGKGFNVYQRMKDSVHEKRMGLSSMQERVNLMGGQMQICSKPASGTSISIKVPLS
jgi:signal transduction histidine kinase